MLLGSRWGGITKDSPEHGEQFLWTFIVYGVGWHMLRCNRKVRPYVDGAYKHKIGWLRAERLELPQPCTKYLIAPALRSNDGIEDLRRFHVSTALFLTSDSSLLQNTLERTSNFGIWFANTLCRRLTYHCTTSSLY